MKRLQSQAIFNLLAALSLFLAGCRQPTKFSTVLEGGFDPVAAFRQHGYTVQNEARGEGIRNAVYGYGWQSWCGVISGVQNPAEIAAVGVVIRDELNRVLGGGSLDELTSSAPSSKGRPVTGMLRYNKDSVHGDMHVWLTPDTVGSEVCYVIFVREERLH